MIVIKKNSFVFRILVGLAFIVSAIMKLNTIDSFEIYVYSLGFVDLNTSFILARLIISIELILGILLIIKIYLKEVILSTVSLLLLFIFYIAYLIFVGNGEHCHCFGDSLQMSHPVSILKNIVFIGLLVLSFPKEFSSIKFQKIILSLIILTGISIPLIVSPPDSFRIEQYSAKSTYNKEELNTYISNSDYNKGKHIICFFATKCRFCKLASKKIDVIVKQSANKNLYSTVFFGNDEDVDNFYSDTSTNKMPYKTISGNKFLKITNGKMPLIILLNNGKVVKNYGYRSIVDSEIIDFAK